MKKVFEPVIGLEVHVQLAVSSKIFCSCRAAYGEPPNTLTCPVCLGHAGCLPVLNRRAVEYAAKLILAVGGTVSRHSVFARKNYFYPDLPKGYQISQHNLPLGSGGEVSFNIDESTRTVRIKRIHLEEDAAKLTHSDNGLTGIDFNRCGVPLIEIVSEPTLPSPDEAVSYLRSLKQILEYTGVSAADMEKGELRCDANISVRPVGTDQLGVRTEIKNLNSFRSVQRALQFEIDRQTNLLENGKPIEQATLLWDESSQIARVMRTKEESEDYRYFPEPDLLELNLTDDWIAAIARQLPELPETRRSRLVTQYSIRPYDAGILVESRSLADFFERVMENFGDGQTAANWIITELLAHVRETGADPGECGVKPAEVAQLLTAVSHRKISSKIAKIVFAEMLDTGASPVDIIADRKLAQLTDENTLRPIIDEILAGNESNVRKYLAGKTAVFEFFVGQVMKATRGRANPEITKRLLADRLKGKR